MIYTGELATIGLAPADFISSCEGMIPTGVSGSVYIAEKGRNIIYAFTRLDHCITLTLKKELVKTKKTDYMQDNNQYVRFLEKCITYVDVSLPIHGLFPEIVEYKEIQDADLVQFRNTNTFWGVRNGIFVSAHMMPVSDRVLVISHSELPALP